MLEQISGVHRPKYLQIINVKTYVVNSFQVSVN